MNAHNEQQALPCPFCGREPDLSFNSVSCGCAASPFIDREDAIQVWNARAAQPAAAQEAVDFFVCDSCGHHYMDDGVTCDCTGRANNPPLRHIRMAPVTAAPADTWFADQLTAMGEVIPLDGTTAAPAHPRALTASIAKLDAFLDGECAELLTPAQSEAAALVLQELKRRMASRTPAAPGIDLTSLVPAEREKPELMMATWHEVAGWNACVAEIRRRIDASPKGCSDELRDVAASILAAFAELYARNGCHISEIHYEYVADDCMLRGLRVTHGDVVRLRDSLAASAQAQAGDAEVQP